MENEDFRTVYQFVSGRLYLVKEKDINEKKNESFDVYILSFLYQNFTTLILPMVCRSIRSHASVTFEYAVCRQVFMF